MEAISYGIEWDTTQKTWIAVAEATRYNEDGRPVQWAIRDFGGSVFSNRTFRFVSLR